MALANLSAVQRFLSVSDDSFFFLLSGSAASCIFQSVVVFFCSFVVWLVTIGQNAVIHICCPPHQSLGAHSFIYAYVRCAWYNFMHFALPYRIASMNIPPYPSTPHSSSPAPIWICMYAPQQIKFSNVIQLSFGCWLCKIKTKMGNFDFHACFRTCMVYCNV